MAPVYLVMVQLSHKEIRGPGHPTVATTHWEGSLQLFGSVPSFAQESHIVLRGSVSGQAVVGSSHGIPWDMVSWWLCLGCGKLAADVSHGPGLQ